MVPAEGQPSRGPEIRRLASRGAGTCGGLVPSRPGRPSDFRFRGDPAAPQCSIWLLPLSLSAKSIARFRSLTACGRGSRTLPISTGPASDCCGLRRFDRGTSGGLISPSPGPRRRRKPRAARWAFFFEREQRPFFQDLIQSAGSLPGNACLVQGGKEEMVERLRIWPLLVYATFVAFAAARRRETEPTCANGGSEKGRALYSARDKSSEIPHSVRDEGSGSSRISSSNACGNRQKTEGAARERSTDFRATAPR